MILINDDCLKVMDRLIELGVKVDAIICDLPYGTSRAKNGIILLILNNYGKE